MQIISADIGNSGEKITCSKGQFFIEGAVSVDKKAMLNGQYSDEKHSRKPIDNIRIIRNGEVFKVGKLATLDSEYRAPVGINRYLEDDFIDLMFAAIFSNSNIEGDVKMVVGLPVDGYTDANIAMLKKRFIGKHTIERPRKKDLNVDVLEVEVHPEPLGTFFNQLLDISTGKVTDPVLRQAKVGIVDIGEFSTDLLVMDGGKFIKAQSKSIEHATNKAYQLFSDYVFDKIEYRIPDSKLKDIAAKTEIVTATGKHSVLDCWTRARNEVAHLMVSAISRVWTDADDMYKIFITGGGAKMFDGAISQRYTQAVTVRNSRFSNSQGMYDWGVSKWMK